jgi:hypothetical protein
VEYLYTCLIRLSVCIKVYYGDGKMSDIMLVGGRRVWTIPYRAGPTRARYHGLGMAGNRLGTRDVNKIERPSDLVIISGIRFNRTRCRQIVRRLRLQFIWKTRALRSWVIRKRCRLIFKYISVLAVTIHAISMAAGTRFVLLKTDLLPAIQQPPWVLWKVIVRTRSPRKCRPADGPCMMSCVWLTLT